MSNLMPNAERAIINPAILRDYALNLEHESGRYKAEFLAQMGYTVTHWQQLGQDIREQHLSQSIEPGKPSPFGIKYTITAPLVDLMARLA